ncbi:NUDIX domain-containing protein [Patescibacteria group bacterium]|nr:NUDIX domain-containing protein [Patescibacteria group bacterium]MBU1895760.1 NUDIX domain-containing protein [Patescibacteria group bacterium]
MGKKPKVGVGVCIVRDGKVLLGKRKNSHGQGTWSFPGGHLDFGESWEDCSIRETLEETGLKINKIKFAAVTNDVMDKEDKHYITIFIRADCMQGDPQLMEPEKCEKWEWFDWNNMPESLFLPIINLRKQGYNPFY